MITVISNEEFENAMVHGEVLAVGVLAIPPRATYLYNGEYYIMMYVTKKRLKCSTIEEVKLLRSQSRNSIEGFLTLQQRKQILEAL